MVIVDTSGWKYAKSGLFRFRKLEYGTEIEYFKTRIKVYKK